MSYLWAEEDCDGEPTGVFRERYFILFPLCGLRWFSESPHPHGNNTDRYDADNTTSGGGGGASTAYKGGDDAATYDAALLMRTASDGQCGWVFGGGITLSRARTAGPHISQYHPSLAGHLDVDVANPGAAAASGSGAEAVDLFPFILELQCDDDATSVRLAARSAHQVRACVRVCASLLSTRVPLFVYACITLTNLLYMHIHPPPHLLPQVAMDKTQWQDTYPMDFYASEGNDWSAGAAQNIRAVM